MKFDPQRYHRRSIRLRGYDYSQPGAYFVTLVTWQRGCIVGEVVDGEVRLSLEGQVARDQWLRMGDRFTQADFPAFVIMPNHMHGIMVLREFYRDAEGDLHHYVRRGAGERLPPINDQIPPLRPYKDLPDHTRPNDAGTKNGPHVVPDSLGAIIRAYKASVTWRIHASDSYSRLPVWQRNYYEHIIRHEKELEAIWEYIQHNPLQWEQDQLLPSIE